MKKLFCLLLLVATFALPAIAQQPGVYYTFLNGGSNAIVAAKTNVYGVLTTNKFALYTNIVTNPTLVQSCGEHASFGMQLMYSNGSATATNAHMIISGYRSYDNGNNFETTAFQAWTNNWPADLDPGGRTGFTNRVAVFDVSAPNATHVGFTICNDHATLIVTNVALSFNVNNTRVYTEAARK